MKHANIRIKGLVQGVFFRTHTKKTADIFQIKGFVRNEADGSLFIEAEGHDNNINSFIQWCHRGPKKARVEKIEITETKPFGYDCFEIRY